MQRCRCAGAGAGFGNDAVLACWEKPRFGYTRSSAEAQQQEEAGVDGWMPDSFSFTGKCAAFGIL